MAEPVPEKIEDVSAKLEQGRAPALAFVDAIGNGSGSLESPA